LTSQISNALAMGRIAIVLSQSTGRHVTPGDIQEVSHGP
jgi:hypothetical protein